jgi:hypothetical protein
MLLRALRNENLKNQKKTTNQKIKKTKHFKKPKTNQIFFLKTMVFTSPDP